MYDPILEALRRGDAATAISSARALVDAQPDDAVAHRLLAQALRQSGDRDGAREAIDRAIALAPEEAPLHLDRAGLLLEERQIDAAQAALARAVGLDPNQFPAYILQGHLALARNDLAEAERLLRTAERIAPEHPHVASIDGGLALRRGDADRALAVLSRAAERAPDEAILRHGLAFAYLAKGHLAFAEQAFRSLLEKTPDSVPLVLMIAELSHRQNRVQDAIELIEPLTRRADATAALHRYLGVLELAANRAERALEPLLAAFRAGPADPRTLAALLECWRRLGDADGARETLEGALAEHPQAATLWQARLAVEPFASDEAHAIIQRWQAAMPEHVPALEALGVLHEQRGELAEAEAAVRRIVEIEPGHTRAELRLIDYLIRREPAAAIERIDFLVANAQDDTIRRNLRQMRAHALPVAGRHRDAVDEWAALHAAIVDQRLPLPPLSAPRGDWPELAPKPESAPAVVLLWGPPGSLVEHVALTLDRAGYPLRADRYGPQPPDDFLQRYDTVDRLGSGELDPAAAVAQWRQTLANRAVSDGNVFDWLLWWDNALLLALRPHLPEAVLAVALRDPRDMLLDWLAYGAPAPLAIESPTVVARWLAQVLGQIAYLHEQDLFPHRLIRLDGIEHEPAAIAQTVGDALAMTLPSLPDASAFGARRFPSGAWRDYREALADAFALLHPVARRLGYAES
ncbi:MAG TPA: tetratricopeptide repeat protein [Lysobacter sp.]|nr:tetratricopeptide repeat protein [Lysobacter sp.]